MEEEIKISINDEGSGTKQDGAPLSVAHAIIWNAVIIAAALIIAAFIVVHGPFTPKAVDDAATTGQPTATAKVDIKNVKMNGEPYVGDPKAKVALAYWSDFQCPYCKQFETTTFQSILKNYVANGKVVVVFKDYAFLGPDSMTAALYSRAVWELYPQQYFAWREAMYNAQDTENAGFGDEASIVKLTGTIAGVDATKVQAQVGAKKTAYQTAIDADRTEGTSFGIGGTPSFITGMKLIPGVSALETFATQFDAQLSK